MAEEKKEDALDCPCCGKPLTEGEKFWKCECGFIAYRNKSGTDITADELRKIISGQGSEMTFTGRSGKPFKAKLKLSDDKKKVVFDIQSKDTGLNCPKCGKPILEYDKNFGCEGRDFHCWKDRPGHLLTRDELSDILAGNCGVMEFIGKNGKPYKARIVLNDKKDNVHYEFVDSKDNNKKGDTE